MKDSVRFFDHINSPIGKLCIVANDHALEWVQFSSTPNLFLQTHETMRQEPNDIIAATAMQLAQYFQGTRTAFTIPYELPGTPFQQKVWSSLATIPYGATRSYKEQASLIGAPRAIRAVARTNGQNPLCIILPCHRVIGSDGSLTGYVGGLAVKQQLLSLEQQILSAAL